eukprot:g636.t1
MSESDYFSDDFEQSARTIEDVEDFDDVSSSPESPKADKEADHVEKRRYSSVDVVENERSPSSFTEDSDTLEFLNDTATFVQAQARGYLARRKTQLETILAGESKVETSELDDDDSELEHNDDLKELQGHNKTKIQGLKADHDARMKALEDELANFAVEQSSAIVESIEKQLKSENEYALSQHVESIEKQLKSENEYTLLQHSNRLKAEHDEALNAARERLREQFDYEKVKKPMIELKEKHSIEVGQLKQELEKLNRAHSVDLKNIRLDHSLEVKELKEEISALENYREEKVALEVKVKQLREEISELKNIREEKNVLEDKVVSLSKQLQAETTNLKKKHDEEITSLSRKYDEEISSLSRKHDEELTRLSRKHDDEINRQKTKYKDEAKRLSNKHEDEIERERNKQEDEIARLSNSHEIALQKQKDKISAKFEKKLDKEREKLRITEKKMDDEREKMRSVEAIINKDGDEKLKEVSRKYDLEIDRLKDEIEKLKRAHEIDQKKILLDHQEAFHAHKEEAAAHRIKIENALREEAEAKRKLQKLHEEALKKEKEMRNEEIKRRAQEATAEEVAAQVSSFSAKRSEDVNILVAGMQALRQEHILANYIARASYIASLAAAAAKQYRNEAEFSIKLYKKAAEVKQVKEMMRKQILLYASQRDDAQREKKAMTEAAKVAQFDLLRLQQELRQVRSREKRRKNETESQMSNTMNRYLDNDEGKSTFNDAQSYVSEDYVTDDSLKNRLIRALRGKRVSSVSPNTPIRSLTAPRYEENKQRSWSSDMDGWREIKRLRMQGSAKPGMIERERREKCWVTSWRSEDKVHGGGYTPTTHHCTTTLRKRRMKREQGESYLVLKANRMESNIDANDQDEKTQNNEDSENKGSVHMDHFEDPMERLAARMLIAGLNWKRLLALIEFSDGNVTTWRNFGRTLARSGFIPKRFLSSTGTQVRDYFLSTSNATGNSILQPSTPFAYKSEKLAYHNVKEGLLEAEKRIRERFG